MKTTNTQLYNEVRSVPQNAQREITAGRLKGFTDINPMWRIQTLTEQFGPCGIGWYYEVTNRWTEDYEELGVAAFVDINLYIKYDGEWSKPIHGTGGSSLVAVERSGRRLSDEAYKMAETDALSVACKSLGFGADIYWAGGRTKYNAEPAAQTTTPVPPQKPVSQPAPVQQPVVQQPIQQTAPQPVYQTAQPRTYEPEIKTPGQYQVRIDSIELQKSKRGYTMLVVRMTDTATGRAIKPMMLAFTGSERRRAAENFLKSLNTGMPVGLETTILKMLWSKTQGKTYTLDFGMTADGWGTYKIV